MNLPKLPMDDFDWIRWRDGNPVEIFGIIRENHLPIHKLRKFAIGWQDSSKLICRPKPKHKAVMFLHDGVFGWFHLRDNEFDRIFN